MPAPTALLREQETPAAVEEEVPMLDAPRTLLHPHSAPLIALSHG
jgi:hypothetical protein